MSNAIFPGYPTIVGMGWPIRSVEASTTNQISKSGMEVRVANYPQPKYKYDIPFSYLNDDPRIAAADYELIIGFYEARNGKFDSFLFTDLADCDTSQNVPNPVASPTPSEIGVGDAVTTTFQLGRLRAGALHLIYNVNATSRAPRIYFGSTLQSSGYTISASGLVTFGSAPGSGVVINADFQYYYRCRFDEDSIEAENVAGSYHFIKQVTIYEAFQ